jgi:hypothetical protein
MTINDSGDIIKVINDVAIDEKIHTKLNNGLITSKVVKITGDDKNE